MLYICCMRDPKNILLTVLSIAVLLLLGKGCKDSNSVVLSDTSGLEKIIADQQIVINKQQTVISSINFQRDTLSLVEIQVKYVYRDKYIFTNTANLNELDSIVRLNAVLAARDTLNINRDSLKCYDKEELRSISTRLIRANECDTLLKLSEQDREYADEIIEHQENIIAAKDTQLVAFDNIVVAKNADIVALQEELFHDSRKAKWLKIGWLSTSGVLGSLLVIQLLK